MNMCKGAHGARSCPQRCFTRNEGLAKGHRPYLAFASERHPLCRCWTHIDKEEAMIAHMYGSFTQTPWSAPSGPPDSCHSIPHFRSFPYPSPLVPEQASSGFGPFALCAFLVKAALLLTQEAAGQKHEGCAAIEVGLALSLFAMPVIMDQSMRYPEADSAESRSLSRYPSHSNTSCG